MTSTTDAPPSPVKMEFLKLKPLPRAVRRQQLKQLIKKGFDGYRVGYDEGFVAGLEAAKAAIRVQEAPGTPEVTGA